MDPKDTLRETLAALDLPAARTGEPAVFVAVGPGEETRALFECLREFFPAAFVSTRTIIELIRPSLLSLCRRLAEDGVCPYLAAGNLHPSVFSDLSGSGLALHLFWVRDCSADWPGRAAADRIEWFKSMLDVPDFYLVDSSKDLYPQVFSMPFLPGERR